MLSATELHAYLDRVGYTGSLDVSPETLCALHTAHVFHIPFENLDIHLGREISLAPHDLFNKLVTQRRGGYCYEMNGLFALVLESLGFTVRRLMARMLAGFTETRPLTHQALLITFGSDSWLADVGNGRSGLLTAIPLRVGVTEQQFTQCFRLREQDAATFIFQTETDGRWEDIYAFTLQGYLPIDYVPANYYNSHSPDSRFVQRKFCTMPTPEGRVTLTEMDLKITRSGHTELATAATLTDYHAFLNQHFGITLDTPFTR